MRPRVQIEMRTGTIHYAAGYVEEIIRHVNAGRGRGRLILLERDVIPTGQKFYIDPDEVVSITSER